tara:strand:- start:576 stop:1160 length:585 start_codon:yes stop_codon:yes gene_type:complete
MKQYAVVHGMQGLQEGYSNTECEFFITRNGADKRVAEMLTDFRDDKNCVRIVHDDDGGAVFYLYYDGDPLDLTDDDKNNEDFLLEECESQFVKVVEIDGAYKVSEQPEWLVWSQLDNEPIWDYYPSSLGLVARMAEEVAENHGDHKSHGSGWALTQLAEFSRDVYYNSTSMLDIDDMSVHVFKIPNHKFQTIEA